LKVYLAARYSIKDDIKAKGEELAELGIESTSRWCHEKVKGSAQLDDVPPSFLLSAAINDLEDIKRANCVVMFSVNPREATVRGGRHWEAGYAYGLGKPLIICGPEENIFHMLPDVVVCEDWEKTKKELLRRRFEQSRERSSWDTIGFTGSQIGCRQSSSSARSNSILPTSY
jgi:nucleoside 2-deoxyribosyltransferase